MLNEKHLDNMNSWKNKLDGLTVLPEEGLYSADALWEKLDSRLRTKKTDKKAAWYWIAAACVFICSMIVWIRKFDKNEIVQNLITEKKQPGNPKPVIQTIPMNIHDIASKLNKKKTRFPSATRGKIIITTPQPVVTNINPAPPIVNDSTSVSVSIPPAVKPKPIVFTALKKKLPVIHINELEKPVAPIESVAGNNGHPSFRVRFFARNSSQESPAVDNENINSLQIKLSPQN